MDSEIFWAGAWALSHLAGLIIMLVLRRRSARQLRVAIDWQRAAIDAERRDADDLVMLTRDRHRRNTALLVVTFGYLVLGVLVLSLTIRPWLSPELYSMIARTILTVGEFVWIGSAWLSVAVGDRIAQQGANVSWGRRSTMRGSS